MAALGKGLSLLQRVELADHFSELLAGLGAQLLPHVQESVCQGVNDRRGDGEGRALRQLVADGIVPARRVRASQHFTILAQGNEAGQGVARIDLPAQVSLARKGVLGLAAKLALRGRGVKVNRFHREGGVFSVHKAPEGVLRLGHRLGRQNLVGLAVRGQLGVDCTFSSTHFLKTFWFR